MTPQSETESPSGSAPAGTPRPALVILTADGVPEPADLAAIRELADVRLATADTLAEALPGAEILLMWDFFSGALAAAWPAADSLRWIHAASAGVDKLLFDELRTSDVLITNARGVYDRPIAEYVLACVLAHDKRLHESEALQRAGIWRHRETTLVAGRRALVVGTGGIGRATARLLRAVGMDVAGAGRRPRDDDEDFGIVLDSAQLADHLGDVDHLVMVAPLTPATRGMLGPGELAALPDGAHVINVGRGELVDQPALTVEIAARRLSAHLDVVVVEPLPDGDPLWQLDGAHISPHMSGDVAGWRDTLSAQFLAHLRTWCGGDEPGPEVDKSRGYVTG